MQPFYGYELLLVIQISRHSDGASFIWPLSVGKFATREEIRENAYQHQRCFNYVGIF